MVLELPWWLSSKESTCNGSDAIDLGSIPGLGRSPGGGNGNPLQYSSWEKSHGQRILVDCSPYSCKELDTTERLPFYFSLSCIGEGTGNPLHYSCLENPMDRRAWWATVQRIAKSWTQLKRFSMHTCCIMYKLSNHWC